MGVCCLSSPLCPRVFYYDYKAKRQQRKWDKETSEFLNIARPQWWGDAPPKHWLIAPRSSSSTTETLLCTTVSSWASWWAVGRDGDLEPSGSRAHFLHLAFLLLLFLAFLFFPLPLLCILTSLTSSSLLLPLRGDFAIVQLSWSCYN